MFRFRNCTLALGVSSFFAGGASFAADPDGGVSAVRGRIEVRVVGPKKAPIAGATVRAYCKRAVATDAGIGARPPGFPREKTDASGWARFEGLQPCAWTLNVSAKGFLPLEDVPADTRTGTQAASLTLALKPGRDPDEDPEADVLDLWAGDVPPWDAADGKRLRMLAVRVTWGGGTPPDGTRLQGGPSVRLSSGELDERGRARIKLHEINSSFALVAVTGYGSRAEVQVSETDRAVHIDVPKGKLIEGEVEPAEGSLAAKSCVRAWNRARHEWVSTKADSMGHFHLDPLAPGPYEVSAGFEEFHVDGYLCQRWSDYTRANPGDRGLHIQLWPSRSLHGRLLDERGNAVGDASFTVLLPGVPWIEWFLGWGPPTHSDGTFTLERLPNLPVRILAARRAFAVGVFQVGPGVTDVLLDPRDAGVPQPDAGTDRLKVLMDIESADDAGQNAFPP